MTEKKLTYLGKIRLIFEGHAIGHTILIVGLEIEVRWLKTILSVINENSDSGMTYLPYAKTNILVTIAASTVLVILNWSAIWKDAGATIEDETGEMNVNADTIAVAAHFFLNDQL